MLGVGEDRYSYVAVLLVQSLGVFGFGAIVHWRKAFFAGIAGIVVGISVLLEEPMRSMNTWYLVLIVGILMLIVVGFIEQRRREIPLWIGEWRHRLESWS
jgi:cell division protein FtsW (lipid II flippase)